MFSHGFAVFNDGLLKSAILAPEGSSWFRLFVLGLYATVLTLLWFYGVHRYFIMWLYARHKKSPPQPLRVCSDAELPVVTVQLAVFNEMYVVDRIIDAVCQLDYPGDKLEIQVLDDSTDETVAIARARVNHWRKLGFDIHHIHRRDRRGFKAGALAAGLRTARGEFVAMFDADFVPPADFLRRQIHFFSDPQIGFVQARWAHINENHSVLTRIQSLFLNGHFVLEHTARQRSDRFFSFSGTAGMWRRATIETSGGWQHDTLVEDADLSYRAQMTGWRGIYLVDQAVPAELPVDMNAFKTQQHRWAKGFIQVMKKALGPVWASDLPMRVKIESTFHLTNNLTYPLMVTLSVLMLPALFYRSRSLEGIWAMLFDLSLFVGATVSVLSFYVYAERQIDRRWYTKLFYMPLLMAVGIGMCLNQSKAVIEALRGHESPFVRTPKYQVKGCERGDGWKDKRYGVRKNMLPVLELFFAAYFAIVVGYAVWHGLWLAVPFLSLFLWGFSFVGLKSVAQQRRKAEQVVAVAVDG
jgi:cellulose synthase/poly-beta-1,6-N-acetylglucosamine synthase-like glycosyltransferase